MKSAEGGSTEWPTFMLFSIMRYNGISVLQTQVSTLSFNSERRAVVSSLFRPQVGVLLLVYLYWMLGN